MISVSVVIPAFNRSATIEQAVASARAQTRAAKEIIVVDDASTDDTAALAEMAGARVIRLESNLGCASARNAGIQAASGDAIAWLDSDDYWEPNHLETVTGLLEKYPTAAVASSGVRLFGTKSGDWAGRIPEGPPSDVFSRSFWDWMAPVISTIIRRDALLSVGGWAPNERYASDFYLWMQLARHHLFVSTPAVTANWRWHDQQLSSSQEKQWFACYRFRRMMLDQLQADGDLVRYEALAKLFTVIWQNDLQAAWAEDRNAWLKQLLELSELVPNVPSKVRQSWMIRSRIPLGMRPLLRKLSRLRTAALASGPVTRDRA